VSSVRQELSQLYRYDQISDAPIGRGGCGRIWRAHDILYNWPVAIKTIDESLAWADSERARRTFIKEAQVGARLGQLSRHIVQVLDLGFAASIPYFVMEWIEPQGGRSTIDVSPDMGAISLSGAKALLFDVCDAVTVAHENSIAHSDIAPWNIIYDPQNRVYKLADFGLLRILETKLVSVGSRSLLTGGRADFLPISVRSHKEEIGYASDVYALAVTFRTLIEGPGCLGGHVIPTPPVIRIKHKGRTDAPPQVRQLLTRFIDGHSDQDTVTDFVSMLQRIPG
jgi:serine/threonine protein kinase